MMTQSRGIPTDRGRISREPGSRNEQSGSRLGLSHKQIEEVGGSRKRDRRERERREIIENKEAELTCRAKAASSRHRQREVESL